MDNSLAAGRRLAVQVVLAQAAAAIIAGLLFLVRGATSALGAFGGGGVVAIGTALLALRVFRPSPARGAVTLRRFALGTLLKWVVVLGGLFLLLVRLHLPLVPVVVGAGTAMAVNWLVLRFEI
ncbi:MAG TPA: ATP synthase subunit I [Rhodanobacteraceae bacterium]